MFDIQDQLKKLPDCPGVYLHKDKLGNIIYVGKAVSLRNRVRQYFQSSRSMDPKVRSMVSQIAEFEYIRAGSEVEALILECNLIKKHRPRYNILLRDDKTYPYIKITNEPWPRVIKTRLVRRDGGRYFGPYSDAGAVNRIVDLLNSSFSLKRCSAAAFPPGFRPCLNYHIHQCRGICSGQVDPEEYAKAIDGAAEFLSGHSRKLQTALKEKMKAASEAMNYEEAAIYRDSLAAAESLLETQRVVMHHSEEADIVIPARSEEGVHMAVFFVREGKLIGRESFEMDAAETEDDSSLIEAFLHQHYSRLPEIPKEILLPQLPPDVGTTEEFLSAQAGHRVSLHRPMRGEKRALVEMATKDVAEMIRTIDDRTRAARERRQTLGQEIYQVLSVMGADGVIGGSVDPETGKPGYDGRQFRAEAYDISNTNGVDTVGAMVTFQGLKADKKGYRKFRVRSVTGQDDYGAMREVLSRRFTRLFEGDDAFSVLPDIIFMDGGKGHVSTALEVIDATGFDIPVIGMVKDDHHRTRALIFRKSRGSGPAGTQDATAEGAGTADGTGSGPAAPVQPGAAETYEEIPLADKPLLFSYIGRMQEEVHRFAIEYHRKVRSSSTRTSLLDEIPGIGLKRRNALLRTFKSIEKIRQIALAGDGEETLAGAESMDRRAAAAVCGFFREAAGGAGAQEASGGAGTQEEAGSAGAQQEAGGAGSQRDKNDEHREEEK